MEAPRYDSLPEPWMRNARAGPKLACLEVHLQVITPILGGGPTLRELDRLEVIRPASVRGQLRFWWRALHGDKWDSPAQLYENESRLWGRPATDEGGRSAVEIRIRVLTRPNATDEDIDPVETPGAYALWPARQERRRNVPPAPRWEPGARFKLTLVAPSDYEAELRNVVRAWILFGGYGGRTRRGLGSLTVVEREDEWLPESPTRDALKALFVRDIFAPPSGGSCDTPWLAGAALHVGEPSRNAQEAWITALGWLRDFRQGTDGPCGKRAREPGSSLQQPRRPSISNWPEPDKVRHLTGGAWAHQPRHNAEPVWPRAGFGLPIIGRFQDKARDGTRMHEPGPFEIRWRSGGVEHERLASPLIVKALPLAGGRFVPCALWLHRSLPADAEAGLVRQRPGGEPEDKEVDPRTAAPLGALVAPGDTPLFKALEGKASLREAFLDWLRDQRGTTVVAP